MTMAFEDQYCLWWSPMDLESAKNSRLGSQKTSWKQQVAKESDWSLNLCQLR